MDLPRQAVVNGWRRTSCPERRYGASRCGPNRSGSISYADGRLYCYNDEDGSVILVEPSREAWKKHGEMKLPEKTAIERGSGAIWAHPIIAGQTLYLRDQDLIFAFDLARQ
jgi:outer membrane protein assembly factor BamB